MKIAEIRNKAWGLGIKPGTMSKVELIRAIQSAEHYEPCFGTANGQCAHKDCCFRDDCLKPKSGKKAEVQIHRGELHDCLAMLQRINSRK
jgi:hypothetical protein